ncbi:MAG TPA: type II toxin-antitoxin system RelE/ParE family toxin, partial [Tepidiformaceae bacterium]|nr:type II toxin-antitoxin system RelE/ParE family toxin [Tepidiformaceae bacterium]
MKVIWSPTAVDAAERIRTRLAEFSSLAVDRFTEGLEERILLIAEFPLSGRVVPEYGLPLLREAIVGQYRIIYEVFPDRIEIV